MARKDIGGCKVDQVCGPVVHGMKGYSILSESEPMRMSQWALMRQCMAIDLNTLIRNVRHSKYNVERREEEFGTSQV